MKGDEKKMHVFTRLEAELWVQKKILQPEKNDTQNLEKDAISVVSMMTLST